MEWSQPRTLHKQCEQSSAPLVNIVFRAITIHAMLEDPAVAIASESCPAHGSLILPRAIVFPELQHGNLLVMFPSLWASVAALTTDEPSNEPRVAGVGATLVPEPGFEALGRGIATSLAAGTCTEEALLSLDCCGKAST